MRSTTPHGMASTRHAALSYHEWPQSHSSTASVFSLFPIIYGATLLDQ
jgi:hypothetical protein